MVGFRGIAAAALMSGLLLAPAQAEQQAALTKEQAQAIAAYDKALAKFKVILAKRRAQIAAKKKLPGRPGQEVYLARLNVMSTYKDLTDVLPERIGRPNKYGIPPTYFDADIEPLIEQYGSLFSSLEKPPAFAQASKTPFKDVFDIGTIIARAKGLDAETAQAAGRISLGIFFAETGGKQNIGNTRSKKYKGSLQTGVRENRNGRRKWSKIKSKVAALDPARPAPAHRSAGADPQLRRPAAGQRAGARALGHRAGHRRHRGSARRAGTPVCRPPGDRRQPGSDAAAAGL